MESKTNLRKEMMILRDKISNADRIESNKKIAKLLFSRPVFKKAKIIAFYLSKGSEVETREMIKEALKIGKEILVPVTNEKMEFVRYEVGEELVAGKYGISEPKTKRSPSNFPQLIIVPGIVFGLCMHRIGYGKGYYDKYLATSPAYRIGICYDFQIKDRLPSHSDDQRMDEIITDKRIITSD